MRRNGMARTRSVISANADCEGAAAMAVGPVACGTAPTGLGAADVAAVDGECLSTSRPSLNIGFCHAGALSNGIGAGAGSAVGDSSSASPLAPCTAGAACSSAPALTLRGRPPRKKPDRPAASAAIGVRGVADPRRGRSCPANVLLLLPSTAGLSAAATRAGLAVRVKARGGAGAGAAPADAAAVTETVPPSPALAPASAALAAERLPGAPAAGRCTPACGAHDVFSAGGAGWGAPATAAAGMDLPAVSACCAGTLSLPSPPFLPSASPVVASRLPAVGSADASGVRAAAAADPGASAALVSGGTSCAAT